MLFSGTISKNCWSCKSDVETAIFKELVVYLIFISIFNISIFSKAKQCP